MTVVVRLIVINGTGCFAALARTVVVRLIVVHGTDCFVASLLARTVVVRIIVVRVPGRQNY